MKVSQGLNTPLKISLDNSLGSMYNIRIGYKVKVMVKDKRRKDLLSLIERNINKSALEVTTEVSKITEEVYGDSVKVYLAGGCLRDAAYNRFQPKDVDLFFVGALDDEPNDTLTYVSMEFAKKNPEYSYYNPTVFGEVPSGNGNFLVEKLTSFNHPGIDFIHHPAKTTIEDVVNDFDYELVKAWYDPYDGSMNVTDDFVDIYFGGRIVPRDMTSRRRIESFKHRQRTLEPKLVIAKNNSQPTGLWNGEPILKMSIPLRVANWERLAFEVQQPAVENPILREDPN